jgi:hypothetical protein
MLTWGIVAAGVFCLLCALAQCRMTLVYMGILKSQVVGPTPGLIGTAVASSIKYAVLAVVLFTVAYIRACTH